MIVEISKKEMPAWLTEKEFKFDVKEVLADSLYYPSCYLDGDPVKYFMGNVHTFVYVDYGVSRDKFLREIKYYGFLGYKIIHQQQISESELTPNGWDIKILPRKNELNPYTYAPRTSFRHKLLWKRDCDIKGKSMKVNMRQH